MLIEVIACSVEDAIEAERGGAGRVEVVRELDRGGLTPPIDLVRRILDRVSIPVRVMIREADGYAARGDDAIAELVTAAAACAAAGVDGIVAGVLRGGAIDARALEAVLAAAAPARATFHHAFDELPDPDAGIGELRQWDQIDRVLTTGRGHGWAAKAAHLGALARRGAPRIHVLAGGGVDAAALRLLARAGVAEAHLGRAAREPQTARGIVSARRVAALVDAARPPRWLRRG